MELGRVRAALSGRMDPVLDDPRRQAAVLAVIYGKDPRIIMTKKPAGMRFHAGEISFPGGKRDAADADLLDTALRETKEEIGLDVPRGMVTGQLGPVATLNTGFVILPFVAVLDDIPHLEANAEVEQILRIPLGPLLGTMSLDSDSGRVPGMHIFEYSGDVVWGATARILVQVRDLLGRHG